jgi:protein-disulfide isomerase
MIRPTIFAMVLLLLVSPSIIAAAGQKVDIDLSSGQHPALGTSRAPITIIEFSDFECPNCRSLEPTLVQLRQAYGDRMRIVWMDFPLETHRHAMVAAVAARCAGEQGRFWPYHDKLMSETAPLSESTLRDVAEQLGLETIDFELCLAQRKYQGVVESDMDAGDAIGLAGTPSLIVNGVLYSGDLSLAALETAIGSAPTPAQAPASNQK